MNRSPSGSRAANLCDAAAKAGARYVILTALHGGKAMCVLFPTRNPAYDRRTRKDYVGAFLDAARARGLKAELYFPPGVGARDVVDPPMVAEGARDNPGYFAALRDLPRETCERHGRWSATPPRRDYNEDIPHVGKNFKRWWCGGGATEERYTSARATSSRPGSRRCRSRRRSPRERFA